MNEKISLIISTAVCWLVVLVVFFVAKFFGKGRTDSDSARAEELERRAGRDNSTLAEAERRTREALGEQAEDNRRAAANNQRITELVHRAEEILNKSDN